MKMRKKRRSGKKTERKLIKAILCLILVWIFAGIIQNKDTIYSSPLESTGVEEDSHGIPDAGEWDLIVVNRWNKIPEDYSVSLTELSNGKKVDSRRVGSPAGDQ